jgi:predicted nucleotidyltransferase
MESLQPRIAIDREKLEAFCRKWKITELALFGSVLRDDFGPDSDVDVLVTFDPKSRWSLFDIVHVEDDLREIFKRDIDLSERIAIEKDPNYLLRKQILSTARQVYAA